MLSQKENGYELEIDNSKVIFDKTGEFRAFIGIPNEKYRKHLLNIVFEDKFELLTNPFTKSIIQTLIKDLKESKLDNSTLKDQLQRFELEIDDLTNQLNQKSETIEKVEKIKGGEDGRFVEENIYRLLLHCYGTNMSKGGFLASSLLKQLLKTKLGEIDKGTIDATVDLVIALPKIISNKEPTDDDKKLIENFVSKFSPDQYEDLSKNLIDAIASKDITKFNNFEIFGPDLGPIIQTVFKYVFSGENNVLNLVKGLFKKGGEPPIEFNYHYFDELGKMYPFLLPDIENLRKSYELNLKSKELDQKHVERLIEERNRDKEFNKEKIQKLKDFQLFLIFISIIVIIVSIVFIVKSSKDLFKNHSFTNGLSIYSN